MQGQQETVEYGGFWRRLVALFIDSLLASLILFPVLGWLGVAPDITKLGQDGLKNTVVWNLPFIVAATLFIYYRQATPGKMLLGLKVVDAKTLGKLSFGQALGRQLSYIVSSLVLMLGFIWVAFDGRKQGWHDKLAGTVVIRDRS